MANRIESSLALGWDPTLVDTVQMKDHTNVRKPIVTEAIATPIIAVKYVELAIEIFFIKTFSSGNVIFYLQIYFKYVLNSQMLHQY